MRILSIATITAALLLVGCSYSPARVTPEPIIEIDGRHDHHHRDRHHDYDRHNDHYRKGGFCPPGQAKKGNC